MKSPRKHRFEPNMTLPRSGTRAAEGFVTSWKEINRFFNFVLGLVGHIDGAAEHAHKVLVETEPDENKRTQMAEEWKSRVSATDTLIVNRQFFLEVILVRHIENYLNYVAALLYEIFVQRPETLRSSEKIDVSVALQCDSIETLVREIAEKKVESLSYSSFTDLSAFFDDRFRLELATENQLKLLLEAIEIRNISVHNRCTINKRYISRLKLGTEHLGKQKALGVGYLDELVPMLMEMAIAVDKQARTKLHLTGIRFPKQELTTRSTGTLRDEAAQRPLP
jgi:hypothetical protein